MSIAMSVRQEKIWEFHSLNAQIMRNVFGFTKKVQHWQREL